MSIFDKYLLKKDNLLRRRVEIDNLLYEKLVELSNEYDASINKLVNIAIIDMIDKENIAIYERAENEIIELYSNIDMLIIDDFGSENLSKWAVEKLYKIIINRYENELPIIITSRYNKNEIVKKLSIENDLEMAEELVQILYRMCYGITISKSNFENKKLA